jgi:hypothetical protein
MPIDQSDMAMLQAFLGAPPRERQDITSGRIKALARTGLQDPTGLDETDIRELCRTVITHIVAIERAGIGL